MVVPHRPVLEPLTVPAFKHFFLLLCLALSLPGAQSDWERELEKEKGFKLSLWDKDLGLRTGMGYKDNILLSNDHPQGSAFWTAVLDALVFRLPLDGWQFNAYLNAEHVQYLDSPSVDNEQFVMATAQVSKELGADWKTGAGLTYTYQHQVFDVSATQPGEFSIGEVMGHGLAGRWSIRKGFGAQWLEADLSASRQWLASPLDGYWQGGPKLTLGRSLARGSELSLSYQALRLAYDTREQLSATGQAITGSALEFFVQSIELALRYSWDEQRRWQTTTRLGYSLSRDNGAGFFDYQHYQASQQLKYKRPTWELSGSVRMGYFDYPVQTIGVGEAIQRHKTAVGLSFQAEKNLTKSWKVFLNYSHDRSISNLEFDDYRVHAVSAGVEKRF